jgi:hypothetical protein
MLHWRALLLALALPLPAQEPYPPPMINYSAVPNPRSLDGGLVDLAWFGLDKDVFHGSEVVDLLWLEKGTSLKGRKLRVVWEDPVWIKGETDTANLKAGADHTRRFPGILAAALAKAFGEGIKVSAAEGDLRLVGRIVQCNAKGSFFSYAPEWVVFDVKLLDEGNGKLLLAGHHRLGPAGAGSGGHWARLMFKMWAEKFAGLLKVSMLPEPAPRPEEGAASRGARDLLLQNR